MLPIYFSRFGLTKHALNNHHSAEYPTSLESSSIGYLDFSGDGAEDDYGSTSPYGFAPQGVAAAAAGDETLHRPTT